MADFDWVTARSNCSLGIMFEDLKAGIQSDINKKNELDHENRYKLSINQNSASAIDEVYPGLVRKRISFQLTESSIDISDGQALILKATPTLCDDGVCRLKLKDREMETWQVRKLALESFLFEKS